MIIRNKNRETFTVISNGLLNDSRISDKALGTLVRLLSKPDNWNLNVNHLVKTGKQGRTAIRSSIAELEKAGYIHRDVVRNKAGRITGTEYLVYEQAVGSKVVPPATVETSRVKTATRDENQSQETHSQETAPVINTNIEQTLRVTTTTAPKPIKSPSSYPATESVNSLLDLIPEQHRQPMVKALVNQVVKEYTPLEVEEAIVYASANVRGSAIQYKAYLDKTLKNQWATGYLESTPTQVATGRYHHNGTVTGCARMDSNYQAAAEFLARRRERHDQ